MLMPDIFAALRHTLMLPSFFAITPAMMPLFSLSAADIFAAMPLRRASAFCQYASHDCARADA